MSRPLRVGHVLNTIGLGGVPEAAWQLLRRLPASRCERHVFVLSQPGTEAQARAERLARFEACGIEVRSASAGSPLLQRLGELGGWIESQGIELLHTHSYKPNLHARLAAALHRPRGLRVVAHYHNQYDNKWQADGSAALDARLAEASDALLACSASVAEHVADRLGLARARLQVLANGVDLDRYQPQPPRDRAAARRSLGLADDDDDAPLLGVVGRLCTQKGQDTFIRAAARLHADWPQARFLVIGSADDEAEPQRLRALGASLGLGEPVLRFTGHRGDMPAVYGALDLLVAPSRWEGFGLMLVEAMACATPIVASRAGAIPEVVSEGETALLVPPDDVAALGAAMQTLLADPALRHRLGAAGPARARDFSWERSARQLEQIYADVMAGGPR